MAKVTPMMSQYLKIKEEYRDALLLFRLGDFYELFFDDAIEVSRLLSLTLTKRHETPMCGVPHHALDRYLGRLTRAGKKVAICEQVSDPNLPGIVQREVVRVVTPGTTFDEHVLDNKANNFTMALILEPHIALAYADITTGLFYIAAPKNLHELRDELARISPAECVVDAALQDVPEFLSQYDSLPVFPHQSWREPVEFLSTHFGVKDLKGFGLDTTSPAGKAMAQAAALLLDYLRETQKSELPHLRAPKIIECSDYLILDETAVRNLELIRSLRDGTREGSLLNVIDATQTSIGGRTLRHWLLHPLNSEEKITARLDAVEEIIATRELCQKLPEILKSVLDLERLMARLVVGTGNARDMLGIAHSLQALTPIISLLETARAQIFVDMHTRLLKCAEALAPFYTEILAAIVENPPLSVRDGGMLRKGYNNELDELMQISSEGKSIIQKIQTDEIARTGIQSLKIRYNNVFGYFIEITKSNVKNVPENYIRKQTLANSERYITPELKEYEEKVLGAEEKMKELEYRLFVQLREKVKEHTPAIQEVAGAFGTLDALYSLAHIAQQGGQHNFVRPCLGSAGSELEIINGRHPVVETMPGARFVPNDSVLHSQQRVVLLTGPNMGGKSTWLRQTAIIALLAHIGSFVPADSAKIPLIDRIFTRVGASDNLVHGQSTFMVEMQETAQILHYATEHSLIILDEIGRGTSTYDGVSLAWSILEFIHDTLRAKTLFATHYHELIAVADRLPHAANFSVGVREEKDKVVFLHRVQEGPVSKSYGIEVARLAGVPAAITEKAKAILRDLEEEVVDKAVALRAAETIRNEDQLSFFDERHRRGGAGTARAELINKLEEFDVNAMTPLDALNALHELKAASMTKKI